MSGEKCDRCEVLEKELQRRDEEIDGLMAEIRRLSFRVRQAENKHAKVPKNHEKYADAEILFREWKRICKHPRSGFTADRFWLVLPFMENERFGMAACMKAIQGAAYDPFETRRKNGTMKRHDSWEKIFESAGTLEDFANRAPLPQQALTVDA